VSSNSDEERLALFRRFVDRFRPGASSPPPEPVAPDDVGAAEKTLDAYFPASITQFWLAHGCGAMPVLAASSPGFPRSADSPIPFQRLFSPGEVVRETQTPRYGPLPASVTGADDVDRDDAWKYVLPIAIDARGRWHCLMRHYNVENDLPVYYFDYEAGAISEVASGFDDLLQAYLRLPEPQKR
jgi:hypothetical protein